MGQVEYAIQGMKLGSTAVGTQVADSFLILEHAFLSLFILLLIAADATFQSHSTHIVLFIFFRFSYSVVIAV